MRRFAVAALGLFVPLAALALDLTDVSTEYSDAPFSKPEAAAISALTHAGAVQGNPDGSFRARAALNRAEFLKIAMRTANMPVDAGAARCFPDVREDWFAPYVCASKNKGIVMGYQDGLFHPERSVTYAEAIKILTKLFSYAIPPLEPREEWYGQYVRSAQPRKVLLPTSTGYQSPLARGEMARLAAAFLAESEGRLAEYRLAEQGKKPVSSSSSSTVSSASSPSSASSSPSSSSAASSESSASSSSVTSGPVFPVRSHFLVVGKRSQPFAGATFAASSEGLYVRGVKVKLKNDIDGIESMVLLDADGQDIGTFSLDIFDQTDKTWKGTFSTGSYLIPKGQERALGVAIYMKTWAFGGQTDRLVQADTLSISVTGQDTGATFDLPADVQVYPQHQTTFGEITDVKNVLLSEDTLPVGPNQLLAAFSVHASPVEPGILRISSLEFTLEKSTSIAVSNWQLGSTNTPTRAFCSVNGITITCGNLPEEIGGIGDGREVRLYGDIALDQGAKNPSLQVSLDQAGSVGIGGALHWTDGTGTFNWVDLPSPLAKGTLWR